MTLIEKIAAAGVVGCGGAGFPTHLKLSGHIEHLIVNGAECEPLLRTDRYIMIHRAAELIEALSVMIKELEIPRCTIALKQSYAAEQTALKEAIDKAGAPIALHLLKSFYPAGDEQTLVYEVTGHIVPPAGIPLAVGAVVENVGTVLAIYDALHGRPLIEKYLTVAGEVHRPAVLRVPVGTSIRRCLELAGGVTTKPYRLVLGGPMMGKYLAEDGNESSVVTKTTSGLLVLPADTRQETVSIPQMLSRARSACIQCSACTQLCPRHLLGHPLEPHRIMRRLSLSDKINELTEDPVIRSAQLCCECGICEIYACPMGLQPRRINAMLKKELAAKGVRYERTEQEWMADSDREERKAPTERVAARAGVRAYLKQQVGELISDTPERVEIPLRMHIGAPAVPCVGVGQHVEKGQLIAECPQKGPGAAVHASISGLVKSVGERIVISTE